MKTFRILEDRRSLTVGDPNWMFACITKRTTPCKACVFLNGTLKRVFTFVSSLFVCNWCTSPLSYLDSAKKEYNCQSHKPSTSVTERALCVVVDCITPRGNAKNRKPYYRRNADNSGKTTKTTMTVSAGLFLNFPFESLKKNLHTLYSISLKRDDLKCFIIKGELELTSCFKALSREQSNGTTV